MFDLFKRITLVLLVVGWCISSDISSARAQNVVNFNAFDDVELQQYFLLFIQQRNIQVSSSCTVLWENYCKVLVLEWKQRENQLENYMIQRGVGIPEHEELPDV